MKFWLGVLFGAVLIVAVACLVTHIASGINDITFAEQIVEWFSESAPVIEDIVVDGALETPIVQYEKFNINIAYCGASNISWHVAVIHFIKDI